MKLVPKYMTKEETLELLDDIRRVIAADDSFEGSFSYEFPWSEELGDPATDPPGPGFRVRASYRFGNSMGQGGMSLEGEWQE